ncbi:SHOCT domain-containing protein [uncultured Phenylobacterium sp.]|uniref:SHOCT domain-containing protein n=1 Tax=uncultured Phenylobacterium sp. TaxID=349273 RepID=UPI0025FB8BBE|nr:SHOCT domain-containing protein [uncultured Phenylobacterium sp.]
MTDAPSTPAAGPAGPQVQLQTLLTAGEALVAHALEHRVYALLHRRHVAAATTARFIWMKRPLLGGYQPTDIRWQDLKEAKITVGMFTASLVLTFDASLADTVVQDGGERTLRCSSLTIAAAQALYRECQAQELAWREKRRVRSMEEMRAQAGGVQIATGVYPQGAGGEEPPRLTGSAPAAGGPDDPVERLSRARAMLAQGLITEPEYEAIKARVVGGL